jgi:hypothetical protein
MDLRQDATAGPVQTAASTPAFFSVNKRQFLCGSALDTTPTGFVTADRYFLEESEFRIRVGSAATATPTWFCML